MKISSVVLLLLSASSAAIASTANDTSPAPTPAATTLDSPKPTPAASTLTSTTKRTCWEVSVEHDATYCIDGPICSGSGPKPAGSNCPKKGDVAIADCWKYLASYADAGRCVAPADAECRVIKTGAWGCIWPSSGAPVVIPAATVPKPTPASTTTTTTVPVPTPDSTTTKPNPHTSESASGSGATIEVVNDEDIQFPGQITKSTYLETTTFAATTASSSSSSSKGIYIGAIAAIGAIASVFAGAALYRREQIRRQEVIDIEQAIRTPEGDDTLSTGVMGPPRTPPVSESRRHFFEGGVIYM